MRIVFNLYLLLSLSWLYGDGALYNELKERPRALLVEAIAREIWHRCKDDGPSYVEGLIAGMREADSSEECELYDSKVARKYHEAQFAFIAKTNLEASEKIFAEYSTNVQLSCVAPDRLYYRTIARGEGELFEGAESVTIHCKIEPIEGTAQYGRCYLNTFEGAPVSYRVADLLPGLAHGMLGMAIGETREIFIHPALAYGCYSNFEPGVALQIEVELVSISSPCGETPPLTEISCEIPDISKEAYEKAFHDLAIVSGRSLWEGFREISDLCSVEEVIASLKAFMEEEDQLSGNHSTDLFTQLQCLILSRTLSREQ